MVYTVSQKSCLFLLGCITGMVIAYYDGTTPACWLVELVLVILAGGYYKNNIILVVVIVAASQQPQHHNAI